MQKQNLTGTLACILALRMLGVFMVLPVLPLYMTKLSGATPLWIGLALGLYGLMQAALQMPLGLLSDRVGRKPVIRFGLILFALGSLVAARGHSIVMIVIGRGLQGCGAIGSSVTALIADVTPSEKRTKAMAMIGVSIGCSFSVAILVGPLLDAWFGIHSLFYATVGFALIGLGLVERVVPSMDACPQTTKKESIRSVIRAVLSDKRLLSVNASIGLLHIILTANFMVIPGLLQQHLHVTKAAQWQLYLPVLVVAFIIMFPLILMAERKKKTRLALLASVLLIAGGEYSMYHASGAALLVCGLLIFFTGFNAMEALLPSLASKLAPISGRGIAMGLFSTCQFMGIFLGGMIGGLLYSHGQAHGLLGGMMMLLLLWFALLCRLDLSLLTSPAQSPVETMA